MAMGYGVDMKLFYGLWLIDGKMGGQREMVTSLFLQMS